MYAYPSYLKHYGIKGMRWGVRRYENSDGSLTALGRKRAQYLEAKRETKKYSYKTKKYTESLSNENYAKRELEDQRVREKLGSKKSKSKLQLKYEEQYKKQGYSEDEASIAAYKRIRTQKILVTTALVAAAAAGSYAAYKHYDRVTDRLLKENDILGRISSNSDKSVKDAFYAFNNKHDANRYRGLYGNFTMKANNGNAFEKTIKIGKEGIKVASPETGRKALESLMSEDASFKKAAIQQIANMASSDIVPKRRAMYQRAFKAASQGKVTKDVYDAFNINLVHRRGPEKAFYNKLKSMGYGAVRDINDSKYSGYGTRNPLIVFDNSKITVSDVKKLSKEATDKLNTSETMKLAAKQLSSLTAKSVSPYIAMGVLASAISNRNSAASQNAFIDKYRKEHPDSKLSRNEILRIYDLREK